MSSFSPMLATASTGASGRQPVRIEQLEGTHMFDLKLDGTRCWIDDQGELRNRTNVVVTHKYPEIVEALAECPPWGRLDGEIVGEDGKFETALLRDKQEHTSSIRRVAKQHPVRFVAFDMPSDRLITTPWWRRREALSTWGRGVDPRISVSPVSEESVFLKRVADLGMEGVIAKRMTSAYAVGKRSIDWIKFKNTQRITCLVAGYYPGQGSRAHFGGMHLALLDPSGEAPVRVGDVGSGFTVRQTHELKARLDNQEVLVVEIEALNVTSGRQLRFPVFRGVRSDVDPSTCTIEQLDLLATC